MIDECRYQNIYILSKYIIKAHARMISLDSSYAIKEVGKANSSKCT